MIMEEQKRYRLEEEETAGWYVVIDDVSEEQCKQRYNERLNEGINPQRLRITRVA